MSDYLKFVMVSASCLTLTLLSMFNSLAAEQAAWGGNGGWWGGGNREWIGDYDGPGYHRSACGYSNYACCYRYPYYIPGYYNRRNTPAGQYYYDDSIPGAGLYLPLKCR